MPLTTLVSGHYWGCSLASPDPNQRHSAIEFTRRYIEVANWLGIHTILVIPGAVDVPWDPVGADHAVSAGLGPGDGFAP